MLLPLVALSCLMSCSNASYVYVGKEYYFVKELTAVDSTGRSVSCSIIVDFDVDSEDYYTPEDDSYVNYATAIRIKNETLSLYRLEHFSNGKFGVKEESAPAYLFGNTVIPKSDNDGDYTPFYANWRTFNIDSEKIVIQTEVQSMAKYVSYIYATKEYAKKNGIRIVKP